MQILLLDRDRTLLAESSRALQNAGYEVYCVELGAGPKDRVGREGTIFRSSDPIEIAIRGGFDVIVAEVGHSEVNASQFLNKINADAAAVKPVIILTARDQERETVVAALRNGAFEFLLKPYSMARLQEAVTQGLDNRRAFFRVLNLSKNLEQRNLMLTEERDHLTQSNQSLRMLTQLVQAVSASLTPKEMLEALIARLPTLVPYDRLSLGMFHEVTCWIHRPDIAGHPSLTCVPLQSDERSARSEASGTTDLKGLKTVQDAEGSVVEIPLKVLGREMGFMTLHRSPPCQPFLAREYDALEIVGHSVSLALRNVEVHRQAQTLAVTDGLTGLLNHPAFFKSLRREFTKTRRYRKALSLMMVDLDGFKAVNDSHGHQVGDRALKELGALLGTLVRDVDIAARYGGDEFTIILPETNVQQAVPVAERIRVGVSGYDFQKSPSADHAGSKKSRAPIHLTISIGVASCPHPAVRSAEDLIAAADQALYTAKANGKNRVETMNGTSVPGEV